MLLMKVLITTLLMATINQASKESPKVAVPSKLFTSTNEQPAASLESEKLCAGKKIMQQHKQQPPLLFENYKEIKQKEAIPLANNKHKQDPEFIVRKQRNLKENADDKLIEESIENIKNANKHNDQQNKATTATTTAAEATFSSAIKPSKLKSHETRYLHDIFINYPKPHHVNFGHVELSPHLFEKRFETQKAGNRFKGEIMWLDNMGGFAQHYWDLAVGRL